MKAIVLQGEQAGPKVKLVTDRPPPKLRPDYVLVDVKAVALNPTDWKHVHYSGLNHAGHLSGCDFAGIVAEVGPSLSKAWKAGDRIAGLAHGGNELQAEDGAFAEQIVVKAGAQVRIPDTWSFEDAAGLGVAYVTVGQGLYQAMGLNWPNDPVKESEWILIYGGSSGMGTVGTEFAKLSGYKVVTTCSPRNFDLAKSFGADEVVDYKDPEAVEKVKKIVGGQVKYVWDTISDQQTADFCGKVIAPGGKLGAIRSEVPKREDITITCTLGYTAIGEEVRKPWATVPEEITRAHYEWMKKWVSLVDGLLEEGKIKPHPPRVHKGLENVLEGMEELKEGKVSGQKLVYTL
ncbi:hypothetical protein DV736_g1773, partial [Chaetothyriales sp. CBS 134916]